MAAAPTSTPAPAPAPNPCVELTCAFLRVLAASATGSADEARKAAAEFDAWECRVPVGLVASHPELHGLLRSALGSACLWEGRFDEARRAFTRAVEQSPDAAPTRQYAESHLAFIDLLRGHLGQAQIDADTAIRAAERYGLPSSCTRVAHLVRARIAIEHDDLDLARADLESAATDPASRTGTRSGAGIDMHDPATAASLAVTRSRLLLAEGDPTAAIDVLTPEGWGEGSGTASPWARSEAAEATSAALLADGDPAAAAAAVAGEAQHDPACAAALAAAQLADGDDPAAALDALGSPNSLSSPNSLTHPPEVEVRTLLVRAQIAQRSGDEAAAVKRLAQALDVAKPEHLRRAFRENGPWVRRLLRTHESLARRHDWLPGAAGTEAHARLLIEPLSDREREVLERASEMMSTQEIADDMYLSVNTVKTHLKNINRKLCATRRAEAVRRARQLGIL